MWLFCYLECVNFKSNLGIDVLSVQVNITLEWMPEDLVDGVKIGSHNR